MLARDRSRPSSKFCVGRRCRALYARGWAYSPHAINGEPANPASRGEHRPGAPGAKRPAHRPRRGGGAAPVLRAPNSRASGGGARCCRPADRGRPNAQWPARRFAASRLTMVLSEFARARPGLRLDVRCDLSVRLNRNLERGELDLILFKREAGERGGEGVLNENIRWVANTNQSPHPGWDPV